MRFNIVGANAESGDDVDVVLEAHTRAEVESLAHDKGILVAAVKEMAADDDRAIALIDDDPPAAADGDAHPAEHKRGMITLNANSPSDSAHTAEGHIPQGPAKVAAMEYHILMNQALYLLETAVNKYIKEGWEPQGGLTIGMSSNTMQYFQALVRRNKVS